jgi:hypothetical protein
VWFSCGAASAALAKLAVDTYTNVDVVYCDVLSDEHPDNRRFFTDVERWIGQRIRVISSEKYASINDVFAKRRYMAGIAGAPCTVEMKKVPRFAYQRPTDIHLFGFTADEQQRIDRFDANNADLYVQHLLADRGVTKADCLDMVAEAGIAIPAMYTLGYKNNNCLGCVKATSALYWNMIRRDFPEVFDLRAHQSREYGARLTRVRGERVFLDELPADYMPSEPLEDISCGPDCAVTNEEGEE